MQKEGKSITAVDGNNFMEHKTKLKKSYLVHLRCLISMNI